MAQPAFKKPGTLDSFSLASIFADAITRDWSDGYCEKWEEVLPKPTLGDVLEHAADLLSDALKAQAKANPYAPLPEALDDAWQQSDGRDSWRDGFTPMMNFAWPVDLGYEVTAEQAAALIEIFAPSCVLIERLEDADGDRLEEPAYEIALTGGGMYLGDHIAAAYLCCGCVPPVNFLRELSRAGHSYVFKRLRAPLAQAAGEAQAHLARLAAQIGEELTRSAEYDQEEA